MEEQKPPEFVFMIQAQPGVIGQGRWHFQLIDKGVPKELVHAFMRHYLQDDEGKYHEFFKETYLGNGKKES